MNNYNPVSTATMLNDFIKELSKRNFTVSDKEIELAKALKSQPNVDHKAMVKKLLGASKARQVELLEYLAVNEIEKLKLHYTIQTASVALSKYRRAILDRYSAHPIVNLLKLTESDYNEIKATARKKKRTQRAIERLTFSLSKVDNYIELANDLMKSNSYIDVLIGLMIITGRRPYELLCVGKFEPAQQGDCISVKHDDSTDLVKFPLSATQAKKALRFSGKAKAKRVVHGALKEPVDTSVFVIPCLEESSKVLQAIDYLRKFKSVQEMNDAKSDFNNNPNNKHKLHSTLVNDRVSSQLSKKFKVATKAFYVDQKPYIVRAVYAQLMVHIFNIDESIKHSFKGAILGHNDGDETTALSYDTVTLID